MDIQRFPPEVKNAIAGIGIGAMLIVVLAASGHAPEYSGNNQPDLLRAKLAEREWGPPWALD